MKKDVDSILDLAIQGSRLEQKDIQTLFDHGGLLEVGQAADAVRRRKNPADIATYIIDRNINYTNVCVYRCRFCAFYRTVKDADAYVLPFDEIAAKVSETVTCGGTGILLQGGVHPELRLSYYESLLVDLKTTRGRSRFHPWWWCGDPRGRHPTSDLVAGQGLHRSMVEGPSRGSPSRPADNRDDDVRRR
jgi:cyclic dehypoxanthinyl futalosine synthase